jgi:transcriptional regulator GlxA family with amidase domain
MVRGSAEAASFGGVRTPTPNSNRSVSSVAVAWGYESETSFGKAFKRVMGCAPTTYRMVDRTRPIDMKH